METDVLDIDTENAQPALMATLWLLGEFLRHGAIGLPLKVRDNLAALAAHRSLSEEARRQCQALQEIWKRQLEGTRPCAEPAGDAGRACPPPRAPSDPPLH
ncbi:MAG TPA: hypothetical protein VMN79_05655 [Casimicrobiaceae bacterium]|nr:hypothetical protein [Casimicrobiaceae bacterium]